MLGKFGSISSFQFCFLFSKTLFSGSRFTWDYVNLDEAHNIKNMSAKRTKEAHKLTSRRRLILTGTPVMNQLDDFYSLVTFFSHGIGLIGPRS